MNNNSSDKEIEKALRSAKASIEVEGFSVTQEQEELVRKKINGKLTHEEFLEEAKKLAKKSN